MEASPLVPLPLFGDGNAKKKKKKTCACAAVERVGVVPRVVTWGGGEMCMWAGSQATERHLAAWREAGWLGSDWM